MKEISTNRYTMSRRVLLKNSSIFAATSLAMPFVAGGLTRQAFAADKTVRILHTAPTMDLPSWDDFEKASGYKVKVDIIKDDPGIFLNEMMVNDGGDRYDLICTLSGVEKPLAAGGFISPIDVSRLKNFAGVTETLTNTSLMRFGGKQWSTPYVMNADSFAYFPDELKLPGNPVEVSWATIFDNPDAMGRTSTGDHYPFLVEAAAYGKVKGFLKIADPANMSETEANAAADYLIERKRAGQFRNFWSTFDQQVTDIKNKEVKAIVCYEPAVKMAREAGINVQYAYAKEFYWKWMHTCMVPTQAVGSSKEEGVYAALDWFLGGQFAMNMTSLRGYVCARPDLALKLVSASPDQAAVRQALNEATEKIDRKFSKELYWFNSVPDNLQAIQAAMDRVLSA